MRLAPSAHPDLDERVFAEQVCSLYNSTWASRYTPFAALFVLLGLNWSHASHPAAILVIVCHVIATVTLEVARQAYFRDPEARPALEWANIYAGTAAIAGSTWLFATIVWFQPGNYVSQSLLSVIILAISTTSMIARFAYLPALGAHLALSLTPLIVMLALEGEATPTFTASLGFLYSWLLYGWAVKFNRNQAETNRLRLTKAQLIMDLRAANEAAQGARIAAEQGRDAAEAGARAKSEFLATVSHEIRTPLNAILGMAQVLEQSELDRAQREAAEIIREAGTGLKLIVDDIIDLSRIEAGKLHVESGKCDLRELVATIVGTYEARAGEKGLHFSAEVDHSVPSRIESDARCLRQILINLVGNAIKFTDSGAVRVSIKADGGRLHFAVADTGTGIPEDKKDRVFAPFSQVDQSYSRRHGGTGLGLAICQRLVQMLNGRIGFESLVGSGSTFWFEFPLIAASTAVEGTDYSIVKHHDGAHGDDGDEHTLVDTAQIARLGLSLGEATLVDVLGSYLDIESKILAQLDSAVAAGDTSAAARAGQDLASASADLGLLKLSMASRALAQRARDASSLQIVSSEADSLRREAKRTHQTLLQLFPELRARA